MNFDATPRIEDVTDNDPSTTSAKLATILAVMTREAHQIGSGVPNEYVQALESVSDLEAFAAVIYSSNLELEASAYDATPPQGDQPGGDPGGELEEPIATEPGNGIVEKAAGVIDAAWGGFESIWGKVMGGGEDTMTG